jgi:hypothetical protein
MDKSFKYSTVYRITEKRETSVGLGALVPNGNVSSTRYASGLAVQAACEKYGSRINKRKGVVLVDYNTLLSEKGFLQRVGARIGRVVTDLMRAQHTAICVPIDENSLTSEALKKISESEGYSNASPALIESGAVVF